MEEISLTQQILASCTGAVITSLLVTPLDVVKIRLQSQTGPARKCFLYCNGLMDHLCVCTNVGSNEKWYQRPSQFSGTFDGLIKIARKEGITSLWSGLSPTLVMAIPATVLYFTSYDRLKTKLQEKYGNYHVIPAISGGIARTGTATIISPIELIRTKMQSRPLTNTEIHKVVKDAVKTSGIQSLWTGWASTLMRDVPFSMLYWFGYESFKSVFSVESLFLKSFYAGFSSGVIATILTQPMDLLKTRTQITLGEMSFNSSGALPKNSIAILQDVISQKGYRGLFAGLLPRLTKIGPACAIMISSYEFGKEFFQNYNSTRQ